MVMTGKLAQKLEITKKREVCGEVGEGRWEGVRGAGNDFSTLRPRSKIWINGAITQERATDYAHS